MTGLPLLYGAVVPLDRATQRTFHLANPQRFGFARDSHLVPAAIDAFGPACRHRPICSFRTASARPLSSSPASCPRTGL